MTDESVSSAGVDWNILDGELNFSIAPREDGDVKVTVVKNSSEETIWSTTAEKGFWTSRTRKGEIANTIAKNTSYANSDIKTALESVWTDLTDNESEYKNELVSPSVEQLIENTTSVEVYGGEDTQFHVFIEATPRGRSEDGATSDGGVEERRLVFDNSEWAKSSGDTSEPPIVEKYSNAFYEVLDISWEEWAHEIRNRWTGQMVRAADDTTTTSERIAMSVTRKLRRQVQAYAEADKLVNDPLNVWYQEDSKYGEVVWVPGEALDHALDDHDKGTAYRAELSKALKSQGYTISNRDQRSINGERYELYPFNPEALGIQPIDVVDIDADDDDDEPAESGAGDDGDGPDTPDQPETPGEDADDTESGEATADGGQRAVEPDADETPDADPPDAGNGGDAEPATDADDELVAEVVDAMDEVDPMEESVPQMEVVTHVTERVDVESPSEVLDAIDEATRQGMLFEPEENRLKKRPSAGETDAPENIDDDGVPDP